MNFEMPEHVFNRSAGWNFGTPFYHSISSYHFNVTIS